jgi:hypothetical protein
MGKASPKFRNGRFNLEHNVRCSAGGGTGIVPRIVTPEPTYGYVWCYSFEYKFLFVGFQP